MPSLTFREIAVHLRTVPEWSRSAQTIARTFQFEGFVKSIDFVKRVAREAQRADHHPDIDIRYDKVTLKLTTHDEGGLTAKDFSLATKCDAINTRYFTPHAESTPDGGKKPPMKKRRL